MLNPDAIAPKPRKHLSFDPLIGQIRLRAELFPDTRSGSDCDFSIADAVMSAIAVFSLKDPSLLAFEERRNDENMKSLFCLENVPSDTQMRTILDRLEPDLLRPLFHDVFCQLQRGVLAKRLSWWTTCHYILAKNWRQRDGSDATNRLIFEKLDSNDAKNLASRGPVAQDRK